MVDSDVWTTSYRRLSRLNTKMKRIRKMRKAYEQALAQVEAALEKELQRLEGAPCLNDGPSNVDVCWTVG